MGAWENPGMTVTADSQKRVRLRDAKPGERFEIENSKDGGFILTRLEPKRVKSTAVRIVKRKGFSVGILGRPVDEGALQEALAEFP